MPKAKAGSLHLGPSGSGFRVECSMLLLGLRVLGVGVGLITKSMLLQFLL